MIVPLLDAPYVMGINIWYDSDEEPSVNYVTRSWRVYQPTEKDMVKGKEVTMKESEPIAQIEEDSVLKQLKKTQAQFSI